MSIELSGSAADEEESALGSAEEVLAKPLELFMSLPSPAASI